MNQEYSTLLDILVEALGSYGPDFRRRLKQDHPPFNVGFSSYGGLVNDRQKSAAYAVWTR